jgi:hypothetical protein
MTYCGIFKQGKFCGGGVVNENVKISISKADFLHHFLYIIWYTNVCAVKADRSTVPLKFRCERLRRAITLHVVHA